MQATMTRQDLQSAIEYAKNRIVERLVSKSEVQAACDHARDRIIGSVYDMYQQQIQSTRQSNLLINQHTRRSSVLETRISSLEQEIRSLKQLLIRMVDEQKRTTDTLATMPELVTKATVRKEVQTVQQQPRYEKAY